MRTRTLDLPPCLPAERGAVGSITLEDRRPPRDEEEAASFKGMGRTRTINRERKGMTRAEFAPRCEMTVPELEAIERGELDEWWGGLRMIAEGLDMTLPALLREAHGRQEP